MLLNICSYEIIGGGWHGSDKEAWEFLGRIVGGSYFPETC